jgi:hypothetical protein
MALDLNPTLWHAYERLTKLGDQSQGSKVTKDIITFLSISMSKNKKGTSKLGNHQIIMS